MTFNSLAYLILLSVSVALFFGLPQRVRIPLLIASSVLFYSWWSVPFVGLIVLSAAVDYTAGRLMAYYDNDPRARRAFLVLSLVTNLAILGYFKYSNFFLDSLAAAFGGPDQIRYLTVLLPPGISFYTFQSMSYSIDVYRRDIVPSRSPARFFLYVCFFPQLVAGPIERAGHLLGQFDRIVSQRFSWGNFLSGSRLIVWGLFKKIMLADYCGLLVEQYYQAPQDFSGSAALIATYAFSLQIYFDFSAYSDIARGSARLFGVDLMKNFDQPLLATNIMDYWRRWHISLYTWFRDYVYMPLGGNRRGTARTLLNVAIVVTLSGLWHGAAWRFVLWGLYHGALMALTAGLMRWPRFQRAATQAFGRMGGLTGWLIQFHLCIAGFVLFCSASLSDSLFTFVSISDALGRGLPLTGPQALFLIFIAGFLLLSLIERRLGLLARIDRNSTLSGLFYGGLIILMILYGNTDETPFFYFQF